MVGFSLGVLKYVVSLCRGCDECCVGDVMNVVLSVCIVTRGTVGARVSEV